MTRSAPTPPRVVLGAAILVSVLAAGAAVTAAALSSLRCDDACVRPEFATSWRDTRDAAEWTAQLVLAVAALALGLGGIALTLARRPVGVVAALVGAVILLLGWLALVV